MVGENLGKVVQVFKGLVRSLEVRDKHNVERDWRKESKRCKENGAPNPNNDQLIFTRFRHI